MSKESVPESRSYKHTKCGQETDVSGEAFATASNPMSDMTRTWCSTCDNFFHISEYEWADTGEGIVDYYARHGAKATALERFLCSKKFLIISALLGLLAGAVVGYMLVRSGGLGQKVLVAGFVGLLGAFIGAAINVSLIGKVVTKRVCGVSDTRVLK